MASNNIPNRFRETEKKDRVFGIIPTGDTVVTVYDRKTGRSYEGVSGSRKTARDSAWDKVHKDSNRK